MTKTIFFHDDENAIVIEPQQNIFERGDPGDVMYVILEGEVAISVQGKIIDTLGEGEIFGEMALIDDSPRSATATATKQSKLVPVDKVRFTIAIQHNPYFALQVMSIMAERLRALLNT